MLMSKRAERALNLLIYEALGTIKTRDSSTQAANQSQVRSFEFYELVEFDEPVLSPFTNFSPVARMECW